MSLRLLRNSFANGEKEKNQQDSQDLVSEGEQEKKTQR